MRNGVPKFGNDDPYVDDLAVKIMDDFPRNVAGKTLKRDMRSPYWEGKEAKI